MGNRHRHRPISCPCRLPPHGRSRDEDFGPGCRSAIVGEYVIVYCVENRDVLILRVVHGRRNLEGLFGH